MLSSRTKIFGISLFENVNIHKDISISAERRFNDWAWRYKMVYHLISWSTIRSLGVLT